MYSVVVKPLGFALQAPHCDYGNICNLQKAAPGHNNLQRRNGAPHADWLVAARSNASSVKRLRTAPVSLYFHSIEFESIVTLFGNQRIAV